MENNLALVFSAGEKKRQKESSGYVSGVLLHYYKERLQGKYHNIHMHIFKRTRDWNAEIMPIHKHICILRLQK